MVLFEHIKHIVTLQLILLLTCLCEGNIRFVASTILWRVTLKHKNYKQRRQKTLLKIVNLAVNVCSNLIGCFEVVSLAVASAIIQVRPTRVLPLFFFPTRTEGSSWLAPFALQDLAHSPSTFSSFFLSKVAWATQVFLIAIGVYSFFFIVTCWNNKPTASYMWFWYTVPFKRKLSKVWRRYYWTFYRQMKLLVGSEDLVKPFVGSTEEHLSWNERY